MNNPDIELSGEENEREANRDGDEEPQPNYLQQHLNNLDVDDVLNLNVCISQSELLLAILKYCLFYNLSQTATADLFKLFNLILPGAGLPQTRYLIDKIFNNKQKFEYHALCPKCKDYVQKFNDKSRGLKCRACNTKFSVKDATYNDFFAIINPESKIKDLIEKNDEHFENVVNARRNPDENIVDVHTGFLYRQLRNSLPNEKKDNFATITFNSDGVPVFESSSFSLWPIQCIVNEIPYKARMAKPIVCGLWFGKNKPDMNMYLKHFVSHVNRLSDDGFVCEIQGNQKRLYVYAICCCADCPARAPIQGLTQFNGYFGCNWCLHPGYYVHYGRGGAMKYIVLDELIPLRTDAESLEHIHDSLTSRNPVFGFKTSSCLVNLNYFKIVNGFVPDSLHLDIGIGEQFMKYWTSSNNEFSFTSEEIDAIDNMMKVAKVPIKITRASRSLRERRNWKGREWENWILYYSLPALLSIPRLRRYAVHWSWLVEAYQILLQQRISMEEIRRADKLLIKFVVYTELYYTRVAMTFNVHQLLHLAQSVVNWGPLWCHSGYTFESGNGKIVKNVHAAKGLIYQICRIIGMADSEEILKKHVNSQFPDSKMADFADYLDKKDTMSTHKIKKSRYFGVNHRTKRKWVIQLQLSASCRTYFKMIRSNCLYKPCTKYSLRSDNSFVKSIDNNFYKIVQFIVDTEQRRQYTLCNPINHSNVFENDEFPIKKIVFISKAVVAIDTESIKTVCVSVGDKKDLYVHPLPNLLSY